MDEQNVVPAGQQLPAERTQTAKGTGHIDQEDRIIPRLKIMQPLSPEVDEQIARPGDLLNSVDKKVYGKEIQVIPIVWWKSRIYWAKRDEGGEIICQARDAVTGSQYGACAECEYSKWHDKESPQCTAIINILMLIGKDVVACSFMKTSYGTGKQLINLFNYKKVDIFNYQYTLYAQQEENDMGKYWVLKFRDTNAPISDEAYAQCSKLYDDFALIREKVQDVSAD